MKTTTERKTEINGIALAIVATSVIEKLLNDNFSDFQEAHDRSEVLAAKAILIEFLKDSASWRFFAEKRGLQIKTFD
jgi:hypothetical protein